MADTETMETTIMNGSLVVDGNLEVKSQLTAQEFKIVDDKFRTLMSSTGEAITFKKACDFRESAQFNNGKTIIGLETTYNSAYVGTQTIQAGERIVVGDSVFKITADDREIIADTFKMSLARLIATNISVRNELADSIEVKNIKVTDELIGKSIYADKIQTKNLELETITGLNLRAASMMTATDLIVSGFAKVNDLTISGQGSTGAGLIVENGIIVARKGIESYTANNRFQTLQIIGSGRSHDICFRIDKRVDSLIEGDVTIQDAKLILDNSTLTTDNVTVTPLNGAKSLETVGIQLTTKDNWQSYKQDMLNEIDAETSNKEEDYDPVASVEDAIQRNAKNYNKIEKSIKTILNPITYSMENSNPNAPGKFSIKNGVYRLDYNGNAMLKNIISEKGRFSSLDVYNLKTNVINVDKLVTTSVASNVVHTDNLLKSEGIAEFDGVISSSADIFIEEGSNVNIDSGANITLREGSSLTIADGAKFEMSHNTSIKMSGDTEIDIAKTIFFDSRTGCKYKIMFREARDDDEGSGILMEYEKVDETPVPDIVEETISTASKLDEKLKELGL